MLRKFKTPSFFKPNPAIHIKAFPPLSLIKPSLPKLYSTYLDQPRTPKCVYTVEARQEKINAVEAFNHIKTVENLDRYLPESCRYSFKPTAAKIVELSQWIHEKKNDIKKIEYLGEQSRYYSETVLNLITWWSQSLKHLTQARREQGFILSELEKDSLKTLADLYYEILIVATIHPKSQIIDAQLGSLFDDQDEAVLLNHKH
ncbi:MAG: hypothetical protein ACHP65_07535 [Legionellales bacterium]